MLNFRVIIEWFFKSFDISRDTKMLEKLQTEGETFVMVIKRHWMYGVLGSWRVLAVVIVACVNVYLLAFGVNNTLISQIIAVTLGVNVCYWVAIIIHYFRQFYRVQWSEPYIEDIYTAIEKSKASDEIFTRFFNHTIFLFLMFLGIVGFSTLNAISSILIDQVASFGIDVVNVTLFLVQLGLFSSYLWVLVNQEMDFKIVKPGQILFYNQSGLWGDSQKMNANKIKTMNTNVSGILASFFHYGNIVIFTEWDHNEHGAMTMDYIGKPDDSVREIEKVLNNDKNKMIEDVNKFLKQFQWKIGVSDVSTPQKRQELKRFLYANEPVLQEIFTAGDEDTKRKVKELYIVAQDVWE